MIPKAITTELIQNSPNVYQDLCLYVGEAKNSIDGSAMVDFPIGLKRISLIIDLDTAVHNGGLWGYFGDITNNDGSVDEVQDVIEMLQAMNVTEVSAIVEEAWQVWKEFLTAYMPTQNCAEKKSFEEFQLARKMRDDVEVQLDPLDDEYYQCHASLTQVISDYARQHPQEFLHPVS